MIKGRSGRIPLEIQIFLDGFSVVLCLKLICTVISVSHFEVIVSNWNAHLIIRFTWPVPSLLFFFFLSKKHDTNIFLGNTSQENCSCLSSLILIHLKSFKFFLDLFACYLSHLEVKGINKAGFALFYLFFFFLALELWNSSFQQFGCHC